MIGCIETYAHSYQQDLPHVCNPVEPGWDFRILNQETVAHVVRFFLILILEILLEYLVNPQGGSRMGPPQEGSS